MSSAARMGIQMVVRVIFAERATENTGAAIFAYLTCRPLLASGPLPAVSSA